jgi:hypothetical protein
MKKYVPHSRALALLAVATVGLGMLVWWMSQTPKDLTLTVPGVTESDTEVGTTTIEKGAEGPRYIEVAESCDAYYVGECLNLRSGPGVEFPVLFKLRNGIVLKVEETVFRNAEAWHKIEHDKFIHYPERFPGDWYVSASHVREFFNEGDRHLGDAMEATGTKKIVVDLSEQKLSAYDGDEIFTEELISAGLVDTPTPRGVFTVFKKTPSRYMQGPISEVSEQYFDLPGVPWNLYFTEGGAVIHGAYWHDNFGKRWSHGCVNLSPERAEKLYEWADIGMNVIVQD